MFKVNNKNTRTTYDVILVFLLLTLNIFHTFFLLFLSLTLNKSMLARQRSQKFNDFFCVCMYQNKINPHFYKKCWYLQRGFIDLFPLWLSFRAIGLKVKVILAVNAIFQIARQKSGRVYVCACTCVCLMGTLICFKKCSKYLTIAFTDKRDFTSFYKVTL